MNAKIWMRSWVIFYARVQGPWMHNRVVHVMIVVDVKEGCEESKEISVSGIDCCKGLAYSSEVLA